MLVTDRKYPLCHDDDVTPNDPAGRYFANILDAIADPVFVKDEAHRWITLNDAFCRLMGHPREAMIGKSDPDFFPAAEAAVFREMDRAVLASGETNVSEEDFTDAQGVRHEIVTKKSLYVAEDGRKYIVGIIRDHTERLHHNAAQIARLEELDRLKDQFVSMLSHELRTPIHTIMGMTTILEDELAGPVSDEQRQYLSRMAGVTDGLLALVNDLLDMSLISSGQFVIHRRPIAIGEILTGVVGNLASLAAARGLTLVEDVPAELPAVVADEQRVGQVLANLVGNAIKFAPAGSAVTVRALHVPGALRCEVVDAGPGIAAADLPRLFKRFGLLDTKLTRATRGTGLGLSISKGLIEAHSGEIGVESEPGTGSTFWFTLPL
ncbi:MAG: sensory transduction histidine kinase [Cyanobacteria bacterium RYN_339]|nr:sensory transduction histidine kinase [Cyanobacteria bacterium RYN_339]